MELGPDERAALARWRPGNTRVNRALAWLVIRWSQRVMRRLNRLSIDGLERLTALQERGDRGLLTFSNHVSRLDDPLLVSNFGLAELPYERMRWVSADARKLFGSRLSAFIFSAGKCVPTVRGGGLDQPALRFLSERLRDGAWVHIFPEGGANHDPRARLRQPFKAGFGRLVDEARPLALPFVHLGMQHVAPRGKSPRRGQRVRVLFGEPADLGDAFVAGLEQAAGDGADRRRVWQAASDWAYGVLEQLEERLLRAGTGPR
jgi:1-acyl-sn-glycerol-3-phosphate acyltransferase